MRILLAVDQSLHSEAAVNFLIAQNFSVPVDLDIMSVIVPLPYLDDGGMIGMGVEMIPDLGLVVEDERKRLATRLAELSARFEGRVRSVNSIVKIGSAGPEIRAVADSGGANLVVVGAVGRSAISRVLLGSVSDYVATHVSGSTLVIRPQQEETESVLPRRILLAVGVSDHDQQLIDQLDVFDLPSSTEIHFVHVMQMMSYFGQELRERSSELWQQSRGETLEYTNDFANQLKERGFSTKSKLLEASHVGEALLNYMTEHKCDLILTSDKRRSVFDRMILGSTSRYVLRHADRSVLIVRAPLEKSKSS